MQVNRVVISSIKEIRAVYGWVEKILESRVDARLQSNILLITQEIVTNAIVHGNQSRPDKKVTMDLELTKEEISITVGDEGKGYPPLPSLDEAKELDYLAEGGRGLKLAVLICDEIEIEKNRIKLFFKIK